MYVVNLLNTHLVDIYEIMGYSAELLLVAHSDRSWLAIEWQFNRHWNAHTLIYIDMCVHILICVCVCVCGVVKKESSYAT